MKPVDERNKKTCRIHFLGFWGRDRFGDWHERCSTGNFVNENCEELIEEGGEKNE